MATKKAAVQNASKNLLARVKKVKFRAPKSYTPILMVLLIVAVFLLGILFQKVQYLEQNGGSAALAGTQTAGAGAAPTVDPNARQNVGVGHFPALGKDSAKVTVVEFADLRCPFCEQWFTQTEPQLIKDYVDTGKVKFYFRQYAFLGPASTLAANAAECAQDQNKFWAFHDYMYKNQPDESDTSMYTVDNLTNIAGQLGMDTGTFKDCLSANKDSSRADGDMADGQKVGVSGTPTIFINGLPIVGAQPYSAFKTVIDQELAK